MVDSPQPQVPGVSSPNSASLAQPQSQQGGVPNQNDAEDIGSGDYAGRYSEANRGEPGSNRSRPGDGAGLDPYLEASELAEETIAEEQRRRSDSMGARGGQHDVSPDQDQYQFPISPYNSLRGPAVRGEESPADVALQTREKNAEAGIAAEGDADTHTSSTPTQTGS